MHQSDVALDVCGDVQEVVTESANFGRSDLQAPLGPLPSRSSAADLSRVAFRMRERVYDVC